MIVFPTTIEEAALAAASAEGEFRAGGTELHDRRRLGISGGPLVDLRDVAELRDMRWDADGSLSIGARVPISEIAAAPDVARSYPGFSDAAGGLATPQIRAVGTLGGNLLQRTRCWYFRSPEATCLKKGGARCYARHGDHLFHACFDLGPCVSVHPSTLGMALLAYEAEVEVRGASGSASTGARSVEALYGDGGDPRRDHELEPGALLTRVVLPAPAQGERSAYFRAISRARSEWPLVEVLARLFLEGGKISQARIAVGGVAPRPLRLRKVEAALAGRSASAATLAAASAVARRGTRPLPMTQYKVELLSGAVLETLERAMARAPVALPARKKSKLPSARREEPGGGPP